MYIKIFRKIQTSQELKEGDNINRLAFFNEIEKIMQSIELDPADVILTNESYVYLKDSPKTQKNLERRKSRPENWTPVHGISN